MMTWGSVFFALVGALVFLRVVADQVTSVELGLRPAPEEKKPGPRPVDRDSRSPRRAATRNGKPSP
jgi:hypothetical protein